MMRIYRMLGSRIEIWLAILFGIIGIAGFMEYMASLALHP